MAEPTDAIIPILQRIQADVTETKRELARNTATLTQQGEKLAAIDEHLTYHLGITGRTIADVETLKAEVAAIKKRVEALERS